MLGDRMKAMRPRIWLPAAVAAVSLTLLGCGGSGGSDEGSAPEGSPEQGTCWAVPAHSAVDWEYWVDDSPQVPCSEPHTTETAAVVPLKKPTVAEAKKVAADSCWNLVRRLPRGRPEPLGSLELGSVPAKPGGDR